MMRELVRKGRRGDDEHGRQAELASRQTMTHSAFAEPSRNRPASERARWPWKWAQAPAAAVAGAAIGPLVVGLHHHQLVLSPTDLVLAGIGAAIAAGIRGAVKSRHGDRRLPDGGGAVDR